MVDKGHFSDMMVDVVTISESLAAATTARVSVRLEMQSGRQRTLIDDLLLGDDIAFLSDALNQFLDGMLVNEIDDNRVALGES